MKDRLFPECRTAVVTGASRGIGEAIALKLAGQGVNLALLARDTAKLEAVAQKARVLGVKAVPMAFNAKNIPAIPQLVGQVVEAFGKIDILVNNAGTSANVPPEDITEEMWDDLMDVNLRSVFFLSQAVYTHMKETGGGTMIHISSIGAEKGAKYSGLHYVASKGGVLSMSKGFAVCGAPFGITSNVVCPGMIETDLARELGFQSADAAQIPLGCIGKPEDVAGAVAYLSSPVARYVTGATIDVNGGAYMH